MVFESDRLCHTGCECSILIFFSWICFFKKEDSARLVVHINCRKSESTNRQK